MSTKGFHGTSEKSAKSIIQNNFKPSKGHTEWLGDGVYFFVEGLSKKPIDKSRAWAVLQSWDKKTKQNRYDRYSIIESDLLIEEKFLLDLTCPDGVEIFEYIKEKFKNKIKKSSRKLVYLDGLIINLAVKHKLLPIDAVKGNFYIKLTKEERKNNINFRTPNSTICNVVNLEKILNSTVIETEAI